jgi:hypothetical protein
MTWNVSTTHTYDSFFDVHYFDLPVSRVIMSVSPEFQNDKDALKSIILSHLNQQQRDNVMMIRYRDMIIYERQHYEHVLDTINSAPTTTHFEDDLFDI